MHRSAALHRVLFCSALLILTKTSIATATTIHVPADVPTIQGAINAAASGDTILVAPGTYTEHLDFKGKSVTVQSAAGAQTTIVDGSKSDYVVKFVTGEGAGSILDGFTITNGFPGGINIQAGRDSQGNVVPTTPIVRSNIITANSGCTGAGVNIGDASPLIQNNTISNNVQAGCSGGSGGAGISIVGPPAGAQIIGNTISGNSATLSLGGGGIGLFSVGAVFIEGNTIIGNAGGTGGGISARSDTSSVSIIQNLIVGNTSGTEGGGIEIDNNVLLLLNNTIVGNDSPNGGSGLYAHFYQPMTITNNIIIGKSGQSAVDCRGFDAANPPTITFNDVFSGSGASYGSTCVDQTGQSGNIAADPLFVNSAGGDYSLQVNSAAIDAGFNAASSLPMQDIAGNDRILDGNGDCNAIIDIGAYEFSRRSALNIVPISLSFADQVVATSSDPQTVTVTNIGNAPATICSAPVTGDFLSVNNCGSNLAPKAACSVSVKFKPNVDGNRSGSLQIITSDAGSPQLILATGRGFIPVAAVSPTTLNFAAQLVGTSSVSQSIVLSSTGDGPLSISNVAISGDFTQTNTCGSSVAPGVNCIFGVTFTPTAAGESRTGILTVTDNAAGSPHTVLLAGTGTDFALGVSSGSAASTTVTAGQTAVYNLQVSPVSEFNGTVTLNCGGTPNLATCTISPSSITVNGSVPLSVTVTTTASTQVAGSTESPTIHSGNAGALSAVFAMAFILWVLYWPTSAPNSFRPYICVMGLVLALVSLSACGSGSHHTTTVPGTPAGTYTLVVTGTSNGVSHSVNLQLTVN